MLETPIKTSYVPEAHKQDPISREIEQEISMGSYFVGCGDRLACEVL